MLPRVLEPEVMDTPEEARDYDAMDHSAVNRVFVADFLAAWDGRGPVLDVGTGTAHIPIEFCRQWPTGSVVAVDAAAHMLAVARDQRRAGRARRADRLHLVDAKADAVRRPASFAAVMSNSIVHHIPDPRTVFAEIARVAAPGATIFVRDLLRPADARNAAAPGRDVRGRGERAPAEDVRRVAARGPDGGRGARAGGRRRLRPGRRAADDRPALDVGGEPRERASRKRPDPAPSSSGRLRDASPLAAVAPASRRLTSSHMDLLPSAAAGGPRPGRRAAQRPPRARPVRRLPGGLRGVRARSTPSGRPSWTSWSGPGSTWRSRPGWG